MRKITALIIALPLALGTASCGSSDSGKDKPDVGDEFGAQVVCEDFVKDRLKSPSTADFGDWEREHVGATLWRVRGNVDSQNAFGAMIRNSFVCTVEAQGDDRYRLRKLTGLRN